MCIRDSPVPLLPEWTQLFRRLNALSKNLAAQNENVTYVPIPFAMTATDGKALPKVNCTSITVLRNCFFRIKQSAFCL